MTYEKTSLVEGEQGGDYFTSLSAFNTGYKNDHVPSDVWLCYLERLDLRFLIAFFSRMFNQDEKEVERILKSEKGFTIA